MLDIVYRDASSDKISFDDLLGRSKYSVLYFYPKDNTPGCTIEAIDFSSYYKDFQNVDIQVIGVSKDSEKSHCNFINKHSLGIDLVSDEDMVLHKRFDVIAEKSMFGKKYMGTVRSTFLLDNKGTVLHKRYNVSAKGHAKQVLQFCENYFS